MKISFSFIDYMILFLLICFQYKTEKYYLTYIENIVQSHCDMGQFGVHS